MTLNIKKKNTMLKPRSNAKKSKDQEKKIMSRLSVHKDRESPPLETDLLPPSPVMDITFKAFFIARCCSAKWGQVVDCDETYNYWEPTHYLLFGKGFQTWEYNPNFALRSYVYLLFHAVPAWIYAHFFQTNRISIFYFVRCTLALVCALCETYFFKAISKSFGAIVAGLTGAFLAFSPGMFISSTAFLPSSFSMYACLLSTGAWLNGKIELAIYAASLGFFLGWPFSALLAAPLVIDMLYYKKQYLKFITWSFYSAFINMVPMLKIDSEFYGRFVAPPVNILWYNVFGEHGSKLNGTEPFTFYFINAFLNFNVSFIFALLAPGIIFARNYLVTKSNKTTKVFRSWLLIAPFYVWFAISTLQPHKREQYLFPVYPILCLSAALAVDSFEIIFEELSCRARGIVGKFCSFMDRTRTVSALAMALTVLFGLSRIMALYVGYQGPFDVYAEFNILHAGSPILQNTQINVCVGKEWHRFPNSFFLPSNNWNLRFIKSEFKGQLPTEYGKGQKVPSVAHSYFNEMNLEENSRYFNIDQCHFLVDYDNGVNTDLEPNYTNQTDKWKLMLASYFLDREKSNPFFRAFFVPLVSKRFTKFSDYNLLISKRFLAEYGSLALNLVFKKYEATAQNGNPERNEV